MEQDLSLKKFFELVDEVSNGDAELLKFKDDDCMQKCLKIKWVNKS